VGFPRGRNTLIGVTLFPERGNIKGEKNSREKVLTVNFKTAQSWEKPFGLRGLFKKIV